MWQTILDLVAQQQLSTLLLVVLAAFGTALFHAVSGFAGGLILSVCLAPILGVKAVIPVVSVAMVISNTNRLWLFREAVDWRIYRAVMITALPGIIIGALIYVYLPVEIIAVMLGVFLIISIPLRRYLKKHDFKVSLNGLTVVGGFFGLMAGTVIGAGLLLGPFLLGAGVIGEGLVGMVAAIGLTLNAIKIVIFGGAAVLNLQLLIAGILVGICTIPGAYAGRWIIRHTALRFHTLLVEILIFLGGCYFIYQGVA
jgi:uncharacterized membrane protein YfcA